MKRRKDRLQRREVRREQVSIAGEAEYIVARAMAEDARIISLRPLVFFSTPTGDAWMLDAEDGLAFAVRDLGVEIGGWICYQIEHGLEVGMKSRDAFLPCGRVGRGGSRFIVTTARLHRPT